MNANPLRLAVFLAAVCLAAISPASAHHMMDGDLPSTFTQGLLSGLGHPVIGLDHLAFLIAVGIAVGVGGLTLALPIVFVAASALGVWLHVLEFNLPGVELTVAASVVLIGVLVALGRELPLAAWAALFGLAGIAHGYAYGESIVGAEPAPLWAYLIGLVIIQSALSVSVAMMTRRSGESVSAIAPRLAGAVVVGVGLTALIGQLLPGA